MKNVLNPPTALSLLQRLPELGREDATPFLTQLLREPAFWQAYILPLLAPAAPAREPFIAATFGSRESAPCLQVFVWPAGAATPIHDHTSWGAYHCVVGSLWEERYARLDDAAQPSTAHLRKLWRRVLRRADGASAVGAYEQGIHRVANRSSRLAVSLHLYGPRMGALDGRDYDPARDFVCDRLESDDVMSHPSGALYLW